MITETINQDAEQASCFLLKKINVTYGDDLPGYETSSAGISLCLPYADDSIDEVYCAHVLQYFSCQDVGAVLLEFFRVLKNGGELYLSVPDIMKVDPIEDENWISKLYGLQTSEDEFFKCSFTPNLTMQLMAAAGFQQICPWQSGNHDNSKLPWSLNLMAVKLSGA